MTAGKGVVHSEMFPLIKEDKPNPLRLFQIWINLPAAKKMVDPGFAMFWAESVPVYETAEAKVTIFAGVDYFGIMDNNPHHHQPVGPRIPKTMSLFGT